MKSAYLGFLLVFCLAACDSTDAGLADIDPGVALRTQLGGPCSPGDDTVNFFPIAAGDSLFFQHIRGNFSEQLHHSDRLIGTLRWDVQHVGACQDGRRVITVLESFDGEVQARAAGTASWYTVRDHQWTLSRTFRQDGALLELDDFSFDPLPYLVPASSAPDTLIVRQEGPREMEATPGTNFCSSHEAPCMKKTIKLIGHQGLVSYRQVFEQWEDFTGIISLTRFDP